MEDGHGPRKSPRKTAGNKPHYLAEEYNEDKGGKGGKKMGKWGGRNGPKNATHHQKMIVMGVLDKQRNQGGLKVVKKSVSCEGNA